MELWFREYVLFIQNGICLLDKDDNLIKTENGEEGDEVDAEDTGEKGYNYRSERFANRLKKDQRIFKVFSSRVHGDPSTPVFKAYAGDRVIFRVLKQGIGCRCRRKLSRIFGGDK